MSDKSFTGLQLPNIGSGQARNPDSGFARIYFKNNNLYAVLPNGSETQLSGIGLDDLNNVVLTSPASGNVLSFNGTNWVNSTPTGGSGGASVTVSATAPTSPSDGDLWWDEDVGKLFIYYNDGDTTQWVEAVPAVTTTGGGGGALGDLTDVTITSVADGDLIRYNGTASEWQNTNLGLTVTPTLSTIPSTIYFGTTISITNWASYVNPSVFAEVKNSSGTVVISDANITKTDTGLLFFTRPSTAASGYYVEVTVQDFGDLASEVATSSTFTVADASFRYWRITSPNSPSGGSLLMYEWELYTSSAQSGTEYPTSNMTSNTAPSPFVASAQGTYSTTYDPWKAFDGSTANGWWNLGTLTATTDYLQIDLGSSVTVLSFHMRALRSSVSSGSWLANAEVQGSNTGAFSGEETVVYTFPTYTQLEDIYGAGSPRLLNIG